MRSVVAAAVLLAGCAHEQAQLGIPAAIKGEAITYETSACFGRCPVFKVTVRPNGDGDFIGGRFTAMKGKHPFWLTRNDYRAFAARIAPFRPESGLWRVSVDGDPGCERFGTDSPYVTVTWQRAAGDIQQFQYNYGCNNDNGDNPIAVAMGAAAHLLPIDDLVGWRKTAEQ